MRASLSTVDSRSLKFLKFSYPTRHTQIGRTLLPIATRMGKGEIILFIWAIICPWDDMVDVELTIVQHQVNWVITNETTSNLSVEQASLKCLAIIGVERCEVR